MTHVLNTGFPIVSDTGSAADHQNFTNLIRSLSDAYFLSELPRNDGTLLNQYVPGGAPAVSSIPDYVFIDCPLSSTSNLPDISQARPLLTSDNEPITQLGLASILYNRDFTILIAKASHPVPGYAYGYGFVLLRNDRQYIYTRKHCIHGMCNKESPFYARSAFLLADVEEIVVLCLFDEPERLKIYREKHIEVSNYLDMGYINNGRKGSEGKYVPIMCKTCGEPRWGKRDPVEDLRTNKPTIQCWKCWKHKAYIQRCAPVEQKARNFVDWCKSRGWSAVTRVVQGGILVHAYTAEIDGYLTVYRTGRYLLQRDWGAYHTEVMQWCDSPDSLDEPYKTMFLQKGASDRYKPKLISI